MRRQLVYSGSRRMVRRRRHTTSQYTYIGPGAFRFVAIAAVGVLLALYVMNTSRTTQNDATLRGLNEEKTQLDQQLNELKVQEARNQTTSTTKQKAEASGMVQGAPEVQVK